MTEFKHHGIARLDHWGLIRAQGEDAVKFLHGQLTQDLVLLPTGQARLAAYCSAKGRMLASFVAIKRADDEIWLLVARDLVASIVKRLQMFVMRSKVRISDETEQHVVFGVLGNIFNNSPVEHTAILPWQGWSLDESSHVVALYPAMGVPRQLRIVRSDRAASLVPSVSQSIWDCSEVLSGVAHVQAATSELFVPQMLNYESVGGVSFKKGCYPGQEVVARSQFRGTLKRRTYLAVSSTMLEVGEEVVARIDPASTVGTVVSVAPAPDCENQWMALLCLQIQFDQAQLATIASPSAQIALMPLPYGLLDDV